MQSVVYATLDPNPIKVMRTAGQEPLAGERIAYACADSR